MGFINRIDHVGQLMFATAEGSVTLADIRDHLAVERREGGLQYKELIDARQASPAVSGADVRSIVSWLDAFAREHLLGPTAVVVSTPVAFGMLRMLGFLSEDFCTIRPFLDLAEAEKWLRDRPKT